MLEFRTSPTGGRGKKNTKIGAISMIIRKGSDEGICRGDASPQSSTAETVEL